MASILETLQSLLLGAPQPPANITGPEYIPSQYIQQPRTTGEIRQPSFQDWAANAPARFMGVDYGDPSKTSLLMALALSMLPIPAKVPVRVGTSFPTSAHKVSAYNPMAEIAVEKMALGGGAQPTVSAVREMADLMPLDMESLQQAYLRNVKNAPLPLREPGAVPRHAGGLEFQYSPTGEFFNVMESRRIMDKILEMAYESYRRKGLQFPGGK